jgi:hypothetical protein
MRFGRSHRVAQTANMKRFFTAVRIAALFQHNEGGLGMRKQCSGLFMVLLAACCLAGCGTVVPDIKEAWDSDIGASSDNSRAPLPGAGQIEFEIKTKIYCELKEAVIAANDYYKGPYALPPDWVAQVSLSLQVDESSAINPGVALITPLATAMTTFGVLGKAPVTVATPQLFSLGLGGTLSSTATRNDKFDPEWTIEYLSRPIITRNNTPPLCGDDPTGDPLVKLHEMENTPLPARSSPLLIESSLGIKDWLLGAMWTNYSFGSVTNLKPLANEELSGERLAIKAYNYFAQGDADTIMASGALTSSLVKDPQLSTWRGQLADLQKEKNTPEQQKQIEELKGELKAGAQKLVTKDLGELLSSGKGKVSPNQIAQFFGSGGLCPS